MKKLIAKAYSFLSLSNIFGVSLLQIFEFIDKINFLQLEENAILDNTYKNIVDKNGTLSSLQISTERTQVKGDIDGSFGFNIVNTNPGISAGAELLIYNNAGICAQWYLCSSNPAHVYGPNTLFLRQVVDAPFRFISTENNIFSFGDNLFGINPHTIITPNGFLPPRMTNAERGSISSPEIGAIVYCTDVQEGLYVYKSTGWTLLL
jgi:hypothetical protein